MKDLEEQLNAMPSWAMVSGKETALKHLRRLIRTNEEVVHIIDGLWEYQHQTFRASIIAETAKRLFIIPTEKGEKGPIVMEKNDVTNISFEATPTTRDITINNILFKTFALKGTVETLIQSWKGVQTSQAHTSEQKSEKNILHKNRDKEMDFLFTEAKKISLALMEYHTLTKDNRFRELLANDIIALSSLTGIAPKKMSQEELLFMAMVLMPLNPGKRSSAEEIARKIFLHDTFPHEYRQYCLDYRDDITRYIKQGEATLGSELLSLKFVRNYDKKNGTEYHDALRTIFNNYCQVLVKADGSVSPEEEVKLQEISQLIFHQQSDETVELNEEIPEETLDEVLAKIEALVGMEEIKEQIRTLVNLITVQKEREARNLPTTPFSLHAVFYGPPGTGKTTIARLLGRVYRAMGFLSKGQLIETDRAGLVAGYVGQTAQQVDEVIQKALDGILFIDEAYTLTPETGEKDFGQEAIDTILKRMEDHRKRLVVIVAGYPDEMKRFINSNPGLKSRFSRYFYFDHYSPEELLSIFEIFSRNVHFTVTEEARNKLLTLITSYHEKRDTSFGNGRLVRNIFEQIVEKQANRIAGISPLTDEILCTITEEDIPEERVHRI